MTDTSVSSIAHIIQLAVAPVFLLAGLGGILNVVSTRLSRVVDRVRTLERELLADPEPEPELEEIARKELGILDRRMGLCHWSVGLCTTSALLISLVVVILFVADLVALNFAIPVSLLFIAAMASLTFGLLLFLLEVTIATRFVRVDEKFVMRRRTAPRC